MAAGCMAGRTAAASGGAFTAQGFKVWKKSSPRPEPAEGGGLEQRQGAKAGRIAGLQDALPCGTGSQEEAWVGSHAWSRGAGWREHPRPDVDQSRMTKVLSDHPSGK